MSSAPAKIGTQFLTNLLFRGFRCALQECCGLHDHAVDAVAALHRLLFYERSLQRMQIFIRPEALERRNLPTHTPYRIDTRSNGGAVEMHRAGAALSQAATKTRAVQPEIVSQEVQ